MRRGVTAGALAHGGALAVLLAGIACATPAGSTVGPGSIERDASASSPCTGRFLLPSETLPALGPAIALAATGVWLGDACAAPVRRGRIGRRGQTVKARWRSCGGLRAMRFRGRISADCSLVRGTLQARGLVRTAFVAARSICGDGRIDAGSGESCEDGNTLGGDACEPTCVACDDTAGPYPSSWAGVLANVFTRAGCIACHDADRSGGLDLRPDGAWANLVGAPSGTLPGVPRVAPGDAERSVLWRKIAKGTFGGFDDLPGGGMPESSFHVTPEELAALGAWIAAGAPATGVVAGTALLLERCRPR